MHEFFSTSGSSQTTNPEQLFDPADMPRTNTQELELSVLVPTLPAQKIGMQILECNAQKCIMTAPVSGNTQSAGIIHGGISCFLVEEAASRAANVHAGVNRRAVGVDLNITHLRRVDSGIVTATATALHIGNRVAVYEVRLRDDRDRLTAIGKLTAQIIPIPGASK